MTAALVFQPDTELQGFEAATLDMGRDDEGPVVCTLIRKQLTTRPTLALLHVHGFNDYFFHAEAANHFINNNIDYYGLDMRKSGRSWRTHEKYNNLRSIEEYFEDIAATIRAMRTMGADKIVLMGHSMGGLVSACYCASASGEALPEALFLNSPFLEQNKDVVTRKVLIPLVSAIGKKHPKLLVPGGFSRFYGPSLHRSARGEWEYNLKFKPHRSEMVNAGWVRAIYLAQQQIKKGIDVPVPILVMFPEKSVRSLWWKEAFHYADAVVNVAHIRTLHPKIRSKNKTVSIVANAKHDLLLSVPEVRQKVYKEVVERIKSILL
ncbi:MAG: alpha/beta hydrolase [Bacteroidetes bacterium]|nr:alpha/beta hydrolase [Bacteroidota bacterium]